ncbi:hypothetical protein [Psychrobacter sp. 16-MNA-CIBAN-0192]|uniref:type IV pilus assembly protein FimV n=1 Tax=Psychrobacter sp. 16-MNA-CIBAN-0192 TaxID=3140448 RepID=UPI00333028F7
MFGYLPSRITTSRHRLVVTLWYSVSLMVLPTAGHTASFGQTTINSAQHEPLDASIAITNFKPSNFSVTLANNDVYQQLGLMALDSLSARFVPTSATSGNVIIRTSRPVSAPFADLVLSINEQGQQIMVPKTLLLPLSAKVRIPSYNNNTDDRSMLVQDNHLSVSSALHIQPLTINRGIPPPLFTTPNGQSVQRPLQVKKLTSESSLPNLNPHAIPNNQELNAANNSVDDNINTPVFHAQNIQVSENTALTLAADKPFDTLNIQVIRRIQLTNQTIAVEHASDLSEPRLIDMTDASTPYILEARVIKPYNQ